MKTDDKNLLFQQPKKKKKVTTLLESGIFFFFGFKCAVELLCLQGLGVVVYVTNRTST